MKRNNPAFQQTGLGAGDGPVDFIGQDNIVHYRTGPEAEGLVFLIEITVSGHVRRE